MAAEDLSGPQYADDQQTTLAAGTHTWSFSVTLPVNMHLPNSMDSLRNQVYYVLRASHWREGDAQITAEAELRVRDPILIDREPYSLPLVLRRPFQVNKAASWLARGAAVASLAPFKALMRSSSNQSFAPSSSDSDACSTTGSTTSVTAGAGANEGLCATLSLARTGYRAGERLRMMISVSDTRLAGPVGVKARLRRVCVHRSNSMVDVEEVVVAGGQRPLDDPSGVFELQLPRRMLSTSSGAGTLLNGLDGAGCITVRYMLEVSLRYSSGPALLPKPLAKFRVPVVIGVFSTAGSNARQRRWAAWWRTVALGDDPAAAHAYARALAAGATGDGPGLADWEFAEEIMSTTHDGGLLPAYEPPPPSYDQMNLLEDEFLPEDYTCEDAAEGMVMAFPLEDPAIDAGEDEPTTAAATVLTTRSWRPVSLPPAYTPASVAMAPVAVQ
ncbi:hypothetical protein THASP1DRAFT_29779 [Thamnocephalis sphaerospora]|uniref:Uncharacterized protein n=1 Tax=Thamnocephalis sphaerospora TaxID=78915 RepID=A0A4P9XSB6_9FUNG|nr:hypothetical protein THASP1DRAFT_29779 [Thamnocephalis sphaerospora]|eukprot:RKP08421.1 hypothetical protein THASP1DRAFT_29779 [Thamnocephalis sphaerospora]